MTPATVASESTGESVWPSASVTFQVRAGYGVCFTPVRVPVSGRCMGGRA